MFFEKRAPPFRQMKKRPAFFRLVNPDKLGRRGFLDFRHYSVEGFPNFLKQPLVLVHSREEQVQVFTNTRFYNIVVERSNRLTPFAFFHNQIGGNIGQQRFYPRLHEFMRVFHRGVSYKIRT